MATKFAAKKVLPFRDSMLNFIFISPKTILSLSKFAKQTQKYFALQYQQLKERYYEHRADSLSFPDWQVRFQFYPSANSNDTFIPHHGHYPMRQDSCRSIHSSAYPLENNVQKEGVASNITFAIVPKEKPDIVSQFLIRNYHQQEPITVALGMSLNEVEGWFQRYVRKSMFASVCDVSVQAIDEKTRKRVGVLCSILIDPVTFSRPLLNDFTDPTRHPVNAQMNEFFDSLQKNLNPADAAGVKSIHGRPPKLLEHLYVSVHPNYVKQGISSEMVKMSESLASNVNNCQVGYTISTSEYSYAIFLKNGYKVVRESKYADYVNSKGEKIFVGKEEKLKPHHTCRAMVKTFKS